MITGGKKNLKLQYNKHLTNRMFCQNVKRFGDLMIDCLVCFQQVVIYDSALNGFEHSASSFSLNFRLQFRKSTDSAAVCRAFNKSSTFQFQYDVTVKVLQRTFASTIMSR